MEKGYDVEVVGRDLPAMYCSVCLLLMYNPIQFECTHALCKPCFERLKTSVNGDRDLNLTLMCPTCRRAINVDKVWEDGMMKRMILVVNVKCSNHNKGCSWIGELGDLDAHVISNCETTLIECEFDGCFEKCSRKDMILHQGTCSYQVVNCAYCDEEYYLKDKDSHLIECLECPIPCKFACGNDVSKRQSVDHYDVCELRMVECSYQFCGCDTKVAWIDLKNHLEENAQFHLSLTMKTIILQNKKYNEISTTLLEKIENVETKIDQLKFDTDTIWTAISSMNESSDE